MPMIKVNFFFSDDADYGWSEGIYHSAGDLTQAIAAAVRLLPLRVRLLGGGARLTYIRASDELVKGDSKIHPVTGTDGENLTSHGDLADIANSCILVRMDAGSALVRRNLYLRGFQDQYIRGGRFQPDSGWNLRFAGWAQQLKSDGWQLKRKDAATVPHTITALVQDAATARVTVTCADAHGLLSGDKVIMAGNRGRGYPNGTFNVFEATSATTFKIVYSQIMDGLPDALGTARKYAYSLTGIDTVIAERAGHRISGRPFSSPRGRRSARTRT